jgi:PAS domain S-box-containing protein
MQSTMPFSDSLYQALFDASPNPYLVLDRQLHIVAANRAYLASTGRTLPDIAGRWAWDAFPTDAVTQQQSVASFERVIATRAPDTMALLRFDIPGADGVDTCYWSITHTPVFDAAGAVAYVIQHPIDVTEIERRRLAAGRAATRAEDHLPAMLMEQTGLFNRARDMFEQNQHLQADLGRLQRLFQHAPGFMAVLRGPEHVYESVNDAVIELMGNRGFVGKTVAQAAPELAAQGFCAILDDVYRTGVPFVAQSAPVTFTLADGTSSQRYLDFIYQPIVEGDGRTTGIFVQGGDVTGRVQAMQLVDEKVARLERAESQLAFQLALSDSLRGLRTVAEITAAASRVLGQQLGVQRVLFAEVDAASVVAVQRDWCADGWPSIAGAVFTLDDFGAGVAQDLRAGRTVRVDDVASDAQTEATVAAHDAIAVRAHMTLPLMRGGVLRAVLTLHCGQPHRWTAPELHMAQDTVERTWSAIQAAAAREALLAAADTLRFTHESARLGDWELDLATGISRTSLRHDECFGYTAPFPNWQYANFMAHLHPDDRARVDAEFQAALAQHTVWQTECRVVWANGELHWVAIFGSVHLVDGVADKIAGIIFDITDRKHAEEEMRLEARRKDEFLAMLAHELRNPLAPIAAAAGILSLGRSDAEQVRKTSAVITRQVNHISSLINDLLDVSRVTRGLVTLEHIPVDIKAAVADAVEQVRPLVEARGHRLDLHLAADHALVAGDKKRLVQVLSNLLNNAAKYTPEHGRIVLSMDVHPHEVVLRVEDNGIGMTPEVLASVFGLFTQAERTADRSQGGLGIGLALVKSLVELHQGTVTVTSAGLGQGSTFSIRLPRLESQAQPPGPAVADPVPALAPLRILVVDDNVDAAQLLAMFLEANGFAVAVEHDAVRALALAEATLPDVCLLDIGLPGMDGNELARRLRLLPEMAEATLVAITGYGRQQDRETAFDAGFDHHFVKPVAFDDLLEVLAQSGGRG